MKYTAEEVAQMLKANPELQVMEGSSPEMPDNSDRGRTMPASRPQLAKTVKGTGNKYGAVRTWSEACQRTFDSKAEARRGEELHFMALAGEILDLKYQVPYSLCEKPRIKVTVDFVYYDKSGHPTYEDVKGVLTRDSRTRYAWLKEKHNVDVIIVRRA